MSLIFRGCIAAAETKEEVLDLIQEAIELDKGVTVMHIRQRQPLRDNVGLDYKRQTFLAKISTGYIVPSARVSMNEEPGAGKPHVG